VPDSTGLKPPGETHEQMFISSTLYHHPPLTV
jgi:hypothetical protein